MKKNLFIFYLLLASICLNAQVEEFYFNDKHDICESSSAFYIRKIEKLDNGLFKISDYWKTGEIHQVGYTSKVSDSWGYAKENEYITYFKNGNINEKGSFKEGREVGLFEKYFSNKQLHKRLQYEETTNLKDASLEPLLIEYFDSLGVQYVFNGNGKVKEHNEDPSKIIVVEEGKYIEGKKDSIWTGFGKDKMVYQEEYNLGKLTKGTSWDVTGAAYYYTVLEKAAAFKGGPEALMAFLANEIKYPLKARRRGIQGRIVVKFIVEKDGSITNYKILKGKDPLLEKEAMRVVSKMPIWEPGYQRGKAVRCYFTLPISFKLE